MRARTYVSSSLAMLSLLTACEPEAPPMVPPPPASVAPVSSAPPEPLPPEDPAPRGRLPADVVPVRSSIALTLAPAKPTFEGAVDIEVTLSKARGVVWMHSRDLEVSEATITPAGAAPIAVKFEQTTPDGVAALRPAKAIGPGTATIHLVFKGSYHHQDTGLYSVKSGGEHYAFTQFEATYAREAFPSFDEPGVKIPYAISLTVRADHRAIANTRETGRDDVGNGMVRVRFAPTEPLPSYLVAFAAGPLDVVDAPPVPANSVRSRPVPLRGVATKGRGRELAYALAHTGEILSILEQQTGIGYPYDKLDVLAVPDKGGAMENPGAVTFSEYLLLVDEATASVGQKRAFASVMTHELAHQWFGDYVTNVWWDDIWLNEAFATWMGARGTQLWRSDTEAETHSLERVMDAMGTDALMSARRIRQPIETTHDIRNAFDDITYQKGGGVISMFERWMGKDVFKKGIHAYLESHRMGNATAEDLMKALSAAAGKDVGTPFRTFLDQPGVPLIEAKIACDGQPRLELTQSRYLPLGSKGDASATWQVPVCARYPMGKDMKESCTLLTAKTGTLPLETCPRWVHPNADAAGYYRFVMPKADLEKLEKDYGELRIREKMALAASLRAGFSRGTTPAKDVFAALAPFAKDTHPLAADEPMGMISLARDWLWGDALVPKIEAYARGLYAHRTKDLGWDPPKKDASPEAAVLRQRLLGFLAGTGRDPAVRREAKKRGLAYLGIGGDGKLHPEAVDPELTGLALSVAAEDGDAALFDGILDRLAKSEDQVIRGRLLGALGSFRAPDLAARARDLVLDPRVRVGETLSTVWQQLGDPRTRDAAWAWFSTHLDEVITKVSPARGGFLPYVGNSYCDEKHLAELDALFATRVNKLDGGPRILQSVEESIRLCIARRTAQDASTREFFKKGH
jgi:alanyl aminopeptidase